MILPVLLAAVLAASGQEAAPSSRRLIRVDLPPGASAVELWVSIDQGATWTLHRRIEPASSETVYLAPSDGRYDFFAGASAPRPGDAPTQTVIVDTLPPVVELLAPNGGEVLRGRVAVEWVARDANLGADAVRIEVSKDGGTSWEGLAAGLPNGGRHECDLASGKGYRFRVSVKDVAGHEASDASDGDVEMEASPEPMPAPVVVKPEPAPPIVVAKTVRLLNFRGGETVVGGRGRLIAIETDADPSTLVVEFSTEGGREGTWHPIVSENLSPASGGLLWKKLPPVTSRACRLRVSHAGTTDGSERDFEVDSTVPSATLVVSKGEVSIPARLLAEVKASISPVVQLVLHVSADGGKTWAVHGSYRPGTDLLFVPPAPGDYGVTVTARSAVGLAGDAPLAGTAPQAVVKVRGVQAVPPAAALSLATLMPRVVRGGAQVDLNWASEHPGDKVSLYSVIEGRQEVIAWEQPATGVYRWQVPPANSPNCRILVESGSRRAESSVFAIDSLPPKIRGAKIEVEGE